MDFRKSDPYAKLAFCNNSKKSTVKRGDLNPTWNEVFTFKIADLAAELPVRARECLQSPHIGMSHVTLMNESRTNATTRCACLSTSPKNLQNV